MEHESAPHLVADVIVGDDLDLVEPWSIVAFRGGEHSYLNGALFRIHYWSSRNRVQTEQLVVVEDLATNIVLVVVEDLATVKDLVGVEDLFSPKAANSSRSSLASIPDPEKKPLQ